jgi:osmotically-inducible protein OsmY
VTLDGTVALEEQVARAIMLALETDGVVDVTANLKVEPPR